MNRIASLVTLSLALAACTDSPQAVIGPAAPAPRADRVTAPAPSPLVTVSLPQ